MRPRGRPLYFVIFAVILAPIAAAVVVTVLLLFGAQPHLVFAPGFALKRLLQTMGIHAPNALGVLATVGLWWLLFLVVGTAWDRRRR